MLCQFVAFHYSHHSAFSRDAKLCLFWHLQINWLSIWGHERAGMFARAREMSLYSCLLKTTHKWWTSVHKFTSKCVGSDCGVWEVYLSTQYDWALSCRKGCGGWGGKSPALPACLRPQGSNWAFITFYYWLRAAHVCRSVGKVNKVLLSFQM